MSISHYDFRMGCDPLFSLNANCGERGSHPKMKLGGKSRSPELSHSGISHYDFGIACDRPFYKKPIKRGVMPQNEIGSQNQTTWTVQ